LWLPGKQKPDEKMIIGHISRQNPDLKPEDWKIFSKHEEVHGTRMFIGISEGVAGILNKQGNMLRWSTIRAQFTPLKDVILRKKLKKQKGKEMKEVPSQQGLSAVPVVEKENT